MKTYLITGGSKGLGKFLVQNYLKTYNNVISVSRQRDKLNTLKLKNLYNYYLDLGNSTQVESLFKNLKKKFKKIDYIISCVGKSNFDSVKRKKINEWNLALKDNFFSNVNLVDNYIKIFNKNSRGTKIIIISSIAGIKVIDAPITYSTAKAALIFYCKHKAKNLSKFNININTISPGNILQNHNVWYNKLKKDKKMVLKYIRENVPLNSFCKPEYIKEMCDYLLSPAGSYITGSNFILDGGQTLNV